jgi:hypothetical protein
MIGAINCANGNNVRHGVDASAQRPPVAPATPPHGIRARPTPDRGPWIDREILAP